MSAMAVLTLDRHALLMLGSFTAALLAVLGYFAWATIHHYAHRGEGRPIPDPLSVRAKHEVGDAPVGVLYGFLLGLLLSAIALHLGVWGLFHSYKFAEAQHYAQQYPILRARHRQPPSPRLQNDPPADLHELQAEELQRLDSYGWVNRTAGTVHIPIAQAMRMIVQQGLPETPAAAALYAANPAATAQGAAASMTPPGAAPPPGAAYLTTPPQSAAQAPRQGGAHAPTRIQPGSIQMRPSAAPAAPLSQPRAPQSAALPAGSHPRSSQPAGSQARPPRRQPR